MEGGPPTPLGAGPMGLATKGGDTIITNINAEIEAARQIAAEHERRADKYAELYVTTRSPTYLRYSERRGAQALGVAKVGRASSGHVELGVLVGAPLVLGGNLPRSFDFRVDVGNDGITSLSRQSHRTGA